MVLPKWGQKEVQSTIVLLCTFVRADQILFGICFYPQLLFINWASVVGRRFSNAPTSAIPVR
jgi:hypothetical protein